MVVRRRGICRKILKKNRRYCLQRVLPVPVQSLLLPALLFPQRSKLVNLFIFGRMMIIRSFGKKIRMSDDVKHTFVGRPQEEGMM